MFDLKGKVALVTGGAVGIGFACVQALLRNELKGVAVIDVNEETGKSALNHLRKEFGENRAIFIKADVSDKSQFEGAFEETVKTFKQLDIVLNNAGIINEIKWEKCVTINFIGTVIGTMLAVETYLPKYRSGSEAVIVNMGSVASLHPFEPLPVYTATKFGVAGLSRAMGSDLHYQRTKIRVLTLCPGSTPGTAILDEVAKNVVEPYGSMLLDAASQKQLSPEDLGKRFVKIVKEAPSGSVWVSVAENFKKVDFPNLY